MLAYNVLLCSRMFHVERAGSMVCYVARVAFGQGAQVGPLPRHAREESGRARFAARPAPPARERVSRRSERRENF